MYGMPAMSRCTTCLRPLLILPLIILGTDSGAFPIELVTLRTLIEKSELIIFAKVEPPPNRKLPEDEWVLSLNRESPARLTPLALLKGTSPTGLVYVYFNPRIVCPSPPRFPANSSVLAVRVKWFSDRRFALWRKAAFRK